MPHGLWVKRAATGEKEWLGTIFSDVEIKSGDMFSRPTAGGGGLGDPLARDPAAVAADVEAGLVSRETARDAYGVILTDDGEIDEAATVEQRAKRNR